MEKSRSFPHNYSSSSSSGGRFGYEDHRAHSYSFNGPSGKGDGRITSSGDPEMKRKRRIAAYNLFTVEGKVKNSVKSSFKWIKSKFTDISYGV